MDTNTTTTTIFKHIRAPRHLVYAALIDPDAIVQWKVPDGMTAQVHEFDASEGGKFRISLTYDAPDRLGKTSAHTDTYHGRFEKLVPNEQIVEVDEFETDDPDMQGEMPITINLMDVEDGTDVLATHDNLPPGLSPADNELGWRMALDKLAALVEPEES